MESFYCNVTIPNFTGKEPYHMYISVILGKFFRAATLPITCKQLPLKLKLLKTKVKVNNHTVKDMINRYNCLLKNAIFSVKTSNE